MMILDYVDEKNVTGSSDFQDSMLAALEAKIAEAAPSVTVMSRGRGGSSLSDIMAEATRAYGGGVTTRRQTLLPAEQQEYDRLVEMKKHRDVPTAAISLLGLLHMRRSDSLPLWAMVNPFHEIGKANGSVRAHYEGFFTKEWAGHEYFVHNMLGDQYCTAFNTKT